MHIMALHNESAQAPGDLTRIIRFFILSQQGHAKRVWKHTLCVCVFVFDMVCETWSWLCLSFLHSSLGIMGPHWSLPQFFFLFCGPLWGGLGRASKVCCHLLLLKASTELLMQQISTLTCSERDRFRFRQSGRTSRRIVVFTFQSFAQDYTESHTWNLCLGSANRDFWPLQICFKTA